MVTMAMDHTTCAHPRTPAGRRACRNGSRPKVTKTPTQAMNDLVERQTRAILAPARIQPRRSGARVSADNSSCVQAALHTRGKCACGWEDWETAA